MTYRDVLTECEKHIKDKFNSDGECIYRYTQCSRCKCFPARLFYKARVGESNVIKSMCEIFTDINGMHPDDMLRNLNIDEFVWLDQEVDDGTDNDSNM